MLGFCSKGYDTASAEQGVEWNVESDADIEDIIASLNPEEKWKKGSTTVVKKPIELDEDGQAYGSIKNAFSNDIKKYARDLDPRKGWEGQPAYDRRRLFSRIYTGTISCLFV